MHLLFLSLSSIICHFFLQTEALCQSKVFCHGKLLHTVQMARIFPDSKTFVDLKMKNNEDTTLQKFDEFLKETKKNPTRKQIKKFVFDNFETFDEFDKWIPSDFTTSPQFLQKIFNPEIRDFAQSLVKIWPQLSRKIKKEVVNSSSLFTLLPVDYGFIIPGGRFREFYYWDSYWIIEGLLLCEMYDTVKGMLNNFILMVRKYGFIPNGSRIYYLNRSHPPLLSLMVHSYLQATNDTEWLNENIDTLEEELQYFLKNKLTEVEKNGVRYHLAHYVVHDSTPRPESYFEDIKTADSVNSSQQQKTLFDDLKAAAESGWDFSSRWIIDPNGGINANLTFTKTSRIIPVDLNAFLCQNFKKMSEFYVVLGDFKKAIYWLEYSNIWQKAIEEVFYDETDGVWYDWDNGLGSPRKYFYPSNLAPLWTGSYNSVNSEKLGGKAVDYLINQKVLDFDGGIPTSMVQSGEQWDYPNAWPPLQAMVVFGLDKTKNVKAKEIAKSITQKWIESNLVSFYETNKMFEKYNVQYSGESGKGGEYAVQSGFGWTNGVMLQLIHRYYSYSNL